MAENQHEHMLACEARHWLKYENWDVDAIKERLAEIELKRGKAATEKLRLAMWQEWKKERGSDGINRN